MEVTAKEILEILEDMELEASQDLMKAKNKEDKMYQNGKMAGLGLAILKVKTLAGIE